MAVPSSGISGLSCRSLYVEGLEDWMGEAYVRECFKDFEEEIISVEIAVKKSAGIDALVNFTTGEVADRVLSTYQGKRMPRADRYFCLNKGKGNKQVETTETSEGNYKLVVAGALPKDITAEELQQFFSTYFPSVKDAEVHTSESHELYGVITFADEHERDLATILMHGQVFKRTEDSKPRHVFYKDTAAEHQRAAYSSTHPEDADQNGSTIYIQNLEEGVSEAFLREKFSPYGEIVKVTIKGCALIKFAERTSANEALIHMNDALVQNGLFPLTVRNSNVKSAPVASSVEDFKELTHQESPTGVLDHPHEDDTVSGFRTCDEEFTDEKVPVVKQEEEGKQVLDALSREVEPPTGVLEYPHEDDTVSGFRTCDEEFTDENVPVVKQEEEGKQVLPALSKEVDEGTLKEVEIDKKVEGEIIPSKRAKKRARQKEKKKEEEAKEHQKEKEHQKVISKEEEEKEHQKVISKLWTWCVRKWRQLFHW